MRWGGCPANFIVSHLNRRKRRGEQMRESRSPQQNAGAGATCAGFTIVELTVALAVLAILCGMGAAGFAGISGKTRVAGDANNLLNAIELTRSEALKRGRRVTLLPVQGDWASGWTVFVDFNANR